MARRSTGAPWARPVSSGLEFCRERLGRARKPADVRAHGDEQAAAVEPAARVGFDAGEDSRRLARLPDAADGVLDDRPHFRSVRLAGVTQRSREIRGAVQAPGHTHAPRALLLVGRRTLGLW